MNLASRLRECVFFSAKRTGREGKVRGGDRDRRDQKGREREKRRETETRRERERRVREAMRP